jgi:ABC-type multidrug transport system ATPase subunit
VLADDRILVLDHGEVVEFGTPWELIQKDGMFRDLCRQSGEDTQLMEVSCSYCNLDRGETDEQMAKLAEERKQQERSN